jgi:hypothetical protein
MIDYDVHDYDEHLMHLVRLEQQLIFLEDLALLD